MTKGVTMTRLTDTQLTIDGDEEPVYENADCPARCTDDHDAPTPDDVDHSGTWRCPDTGEVFTLHYAPDYTGEEEPEWRANHRTFREYSYEVSRGQWLIDPWDYDLNTCASCGEWHNVYDLHYVERWEEYYCHRHVPVLHSCYRCDSEVTDDEVLHLDGDPYCEYCYDCEREEREEQRADGPADSEYRAPAGVLTCQDCRTALTIEALWLDTMTETLHCEEHSHGNADRIRIVRVFANAA
jgi:hypothetical protein